MKQSGMLSLVLAGGLVVGAAACGTQDSRSVDPAIDDRASEVSDAAKDAASEARDAVVGAAETVDVKTALMADDLVDASDVNVDTNAALKVVVLKGSVPTDVQRERAEQIAAREAPGYRIDNLLVVAAR